jgi:hypothetical protein
MPGPTGFELRRRVLLGGCGSRRCKNDLPVERNANSDMGHPGCVCMSSAPGLPAKQARLPALGLDRLRCTPGALSSWPISDPDQLEIDYRVRARVGCSDPGFGFRSQWTRNPASRVVPSLMPITALRWSSPHDQFKSTHPISSSIKKALRVFSCTRSMLWPTSRRGPRADLASRPTSRHS